MQECCQKLVSQYAAVHDVGADFGQIYMNAQMRQMKRSMDKLGDYMENIQ